MTSILRLGSKDRSPFLFRRHGTANTGEITTDLLAHRLPDISRVDTRSLLGLFDEFGKFDHLDALPRLPPDQQLSIAPKPEIRVSNVIANRPTDDAKPLRHQPQQRKVELIRNESTSSSCYSHPSHRESDYSPLVTRQSSSSSYAQESPFASSATPSLEVNSLKTTSQSSKSRLIYLMDGHAQTQRFNSNTAFSSVAIVSQPPNLDKPLPPGPSASQKASLSVPDLLLRQLPAELPSNEPPSRLNRMERVSSGTRSASARRASDGQTVAELPSWRSRSVQEARPRNLKVRRTDPPPTQADRQQHAVSELEKYHRHTADILTSTGQVQPKPKPNKQRRNKLFKPITAATAEQVIYKIMCNVHSLEDLKSTAMVSKGFYRTFHRNESNLVNHLIFKTSRPAWEFRRSVLALKGSNDFALKEFRRDCKNLSALKAFMLAHCGSTCKPSLLVGLLGQNEERVNQIDNALWRIWTFCTLFRDMAGQGSTSQAQVDWLNGSRASNKNMGAGFAIGNGKGLTTTELEDMNGFWQCLRTLLSGFQGHESEAKQAGVFDNWHLRETTTESQHLGEWICYLLTLGPQTVLALSSCSFDQAKMSGLTKWPAPLAGQSRSSFLTTAIAQVYQERLLEDATLRAAQFSLPRIPGRHPQHGRKPSHRPTRSFDERQLASMPMRATQNQTQSLRIDTTLPRRRPVSMVAHSDARLEVRPDCDPVNNQPSQTAAQMFPATPTADPSAFYALGMTPTASAKLGATLFPMEYVSRAPRVPFLAVGQPAAPTPGVVDPVDRAMTVLVHELGFNEVRAGKALAMCDTGSGIDLEKAIELLTVDAKDSKDEVASPVELPTPSIMSSPPRSKKQPKDFCDGQCSRSSTAAHSRKPSTGTVTDASISPISIYDEAEWQDTISPLATTANPTTRSKTILKRGPSKGAKAWKVLGIDSAPRRKNSVLGIEEYQAKVERRKSMRAVNGGQDPSVKEGLSKNLLGLGLGFGSGAGAKSAEQQLERARDQERRKKEKSPKLIQMPRYA
ncbi:hypothetical protein LTR92_008800 [Exophiala xenobiotica]|nr:hypothetical protein LTR92_008800 [Exophiala xenobiotica]